MYRIDYFKIKWNVKDENKRYVNIIHILGKKYISMPLKCKLIFKIFPD